jgi:hypothetical protein
VFESDLNDYFDDQVNAKNSIIWYSYDSVCIVPTCLSLSYGTVMQGAPVEGRLLLQLTSQKAEAADVLQRQRRKNARRGKAAAAHCSQSALPPNPF